MGKDAVMWAILILAWFRMVVVAARLVHEALLQSPNFTYQLVGGESWPGAMSSSRLIGPVSHPSFPCRTLKSWSSVMSGFQRSSPIVPDGNDRQTQRPGRGRMAGITVVNGIPSARRVKLRTDPSSSAVVLQSCASGSGLTCWKRMPLVISRRCCCKDAMPTVQHHR